MSKLNKTKQLSIMIIALLFTFSCTKDLGLDEPNSFAHDNFVELAQIKDIASSIYFPSKTKGDRTTIKHVNSIKEVKNKNNKTSFYVINYDEGGFVILSADRRTQPVLGFSVSNRFTIEESSYPDGLEYWMNDAKARISNIQKSNIKQSDNEKLAWRLVREAIINEISSSKNEPIEDCYEHTVTYIKGPLLNTTWYQTGSFNDNLPYITCNGSSFQVYAGCVPIAMAQVMKYYQYPTNYNWSSMPSSYATSTTASFIKDIHDAIGNVYSGEPSYSCSGTGVSSSANMGNVLKTQFNYSSANKANYNYITVKSNINSNRPVMLSGNNGTSGHMWVCDGYRSTQYFFDDCSGISYLHLHMNWGWGGNYDGWFSYTNFNPANTNFNQDKKMIYNIIP